MKSDRGLRTLALVVFFLSGIAGLIYQVVWTRLLGFTMGNSMLSIATVVSTFMAGLALGSFAAGRVADRLRSPFLIFGILEALIGAYCLVLPLVIGFTEPLLRSIYQSMGPQFLTFRAIQFAVCGAVLLVPTTLMGATLPILSKHVAHRLGDVGWTVGRLYSVNTFGAVVGAFLTGFVLIPELGISTTTLVGASLNFVVATIVVLSWLGTGRTKVADPVEEAVAVKPAPGLGGDEKPLRGLVLAGLLLAFFASGFSAMTYQIGWTRVLSLVFGPSVYNFSLIVTTFILGLAVGALLVARIVDRTRDPYLLLAACQLLIGLTALAAHYSFGRLPFDLVDLYLGADEMGFGKLQFEKLRRAFVLMVPPTILMGAVFPIAARILARDLRKVGRAVGNAYSVSTVGSILGSFLTGFLLIPALGIEGTLLFGIAMSLGVGVLLVVLSMVQRGFGLRTVAVLPLLALFALALRLPHWDSEVLGSGVYLYARHHRDILEEHPERIREMMLGDTELLYHEEGITTTVSVRRSQGGLLYMKTSGKTDASSAEDMYTQILCGHIPLFLHPDPREICVVGLGSGVTLGSAGLHEIDRADCVEISAEVVKGARYFEGVNHGAMSQPGRLDIVVEDGRNFLAMAGRKYDAILSEPSNPWIAGVGSLFTLEYFQACKNALKPGGIMSQWANSYNMGHEEFRSVLRTFMQVFPNVMLWETVLGTDYLLVGLPEDYGLIDLERVRTLMATDVIHEDLARIGVESPESFLKHFVMAREQAARFCGEGPIHTDDYTFLEYRLPKNLYLSGAARDRKYEAFLSRLQGVRETVLPYLKNLDGLPDRKAFENRVTDLYRSRQLATEGWIELCTRRAYDRALTAFEQALELDPSDGDTRNHLCQLLVELGRRTLGSDEDLPLALALFKQAVSFKKENRVATEYANRVGLYVASRLVEQGSLDDAYREYMDVWKRDVHNIEALAGVADVQRERGNYMEAIRLLQSAMADQPQNAELFRRRGTLWFDVEEFDRAVEDWQVAVSLEPETAAYRNNLGLALWRAGRPDEAVTQFNRLLKNDPDYARAYLGVGQIYLERGDLEQASSAFTSALRIDPTMDGLGAVVEQLLRLEMERGRMDTAFHWLGQVVRLRLREPGALRSDPALEPLRRDRRFEETLARWKEEPAPVAEGS